MFPCEIKHFETRPVLSIRFRCAAQDLPEYFGRVYGAISRYLGELGEDHAGPAFAAYYNLDMQNLDVEGGFPVSRPLPGKGDIIASEIPGGLYAVCHYTGPYDQVGPAWEHMMQVASEKGYRPHHVSYEWYLNSPEEVPAEELRTDLAFAVTPVEDVVPI